jgi:hypothetical protein
MKAEDAILNVLLTARPGTIVEVRQPRAGKLEFTIEEVRKAIAIMSNQHAGTEGIITDTLEGRALSWAMRPIETKGDAADLLLSFAESELATLRAERDRLKQLVDAATPIDAILFCPECKFQHVDKAEPDKCESCGHSRANHYTGEPAEDPHDEGTACADCDLDGRFEKCISYKAWLNPPHKKHRCHNCNLVWKAANVPTNGVESPLDAYDSILSAAGEGKE